MIHAEHLRGSAAGDAEPLDELVIVVKAWTRRVPLAGRPLLCGRSTECDVQIADPSVSRQHARLVPVADGRWRVEDLSLPIASHVTLGPGQRIQLGPVELAIERRPPLSSVLSGDPLRDTRNVEMLLQTLGDVHASEDQDELLRTIVDRAIALAGGDRGGLFLAGPLGSLEAGVARDAQCRDLPQEQRLGRSLPLQALGSGRAVVFTDVEDIGEGAILPESVYDSELRSVLCVPVPGQEGPLGVLYVDGSRPASAFGPAELSVFEALAVHGALAIERARLREDQLRRERDARRRLEMENATLRAQLGAESPIGESEPIRKVFDLLRRVASSDAIVCLTGETGTGKEILARYLHRCSTRAAGPFVVVDCGAIPEGLIESELFGHEKGAFTGASAPREGRFREAWGGTVFLDEIGELPLHLQTRLLRVVQDRAVQSVGGTGWIPIDVRIVCATHRDLGQRMAEGRFREDLFYRISVLTVAIPPLRERRQDILLLARHFLARFAAAYGASVTGFTREAEQALASHTWPGNVRELENRVQRAVLLARPPYASRRDLGLAEADVGDAPTPAEEDLPQMPLQQARAEATERFERAYLADTLRRAGGNVSKAAAAADISRQVFHRLLRKHDIDRSDFTE
jgi:transcriptional regulator with GAF, ATPase, and Fis domain